MTRQRLHRRFIIDGTTATGTAPDDYIHDRMGPRAEINTFERVLEKLIAGYNIESMPLHYSGEFGDVVALYDEDSDDRPTNFQVTYNPAWMPDGADELPEGKSTPIWDIVTNTYTPTGPGAMWIPLWDVLEANDIEVFGEIRLTRSGGQMHMDLFFPNKRVEYEEFEHTLGISTGHDYYGNTRLYAEVVALDMARDLRKRGVHVLRELTDAKKRKHTGDADDDVADWWEVTIEKTDRVTETLYNAVTDAMHYEIDIGEMPVQLDEFYEHLGLPNSGRSEVADKAAARALSTVMGGYDAYHLHRAAMHALEDTYAGKDTRAFVTHTATVNTLLFNPPQAERDVLESVHSEIDEGETTLSAFEDASGAEIETRREEVADRITTIDEGVREFESVRERLRTMLEDADAEPETEEAA